MSPEMPRYRCHKEVHALKIANTIEFLPDGGAKLHIADAGYEPVHVDRAVIARYHPKPGDYLVVYDDGYRSIIPAKAFEEGYIRISPMTQDGKNWKP